MKYSIVVPTYNRCDDLLRPCLETLKQYTDLDDSEVIVVANGCTDNTREFVESLGNPFKLVWFDQAMGYTKATNAGMAMALGEFVIPFSNDVALLPAPKNEWIRRLNEPFINNEKMALTGDLTLYSEDAGDNFIVFQCAMIKRSILAEIGMLDEIFSPGYGEDIDFSLRVRQRGYEWKCIDDKTYDGKQWVGTFPACHVGTATFKTIPEYGSVIVPRNQAILRERYNKPTGLKLHLACGLDYLEGYVNVDLYPQKGARVDASFDVKKLPYDNNSVDEIRALHIIEHFDFYEGQEVLKEWFRVLKPGGKLILETPDLLESCRAFVDGNEDERVHLYGHFFAQAWIPGQVHKFLFTETQLKTQLGWAGFDRVNRIAPMSNYLKSYPNDLLFLAVEAYKFNFNRLERQDPIVYKEIFKDNDYQVRESEIRNKIVIDIGANVGMFSLYAMSLSAHRVYAVEAQPNIYKTLLENTNGVGSIVPLNYAVYSESGKIVRLSNEKGLSKIQESGDAATTITLEKLLADNNILGDELVLKMDCDGAEFDILLNTDRKILSRFKTVYIEIHGNTNQNPEYRNVDTIESLLSSLGLTKSSSLQYYEYNTIDGVTHSKPMQTFIQKWVR